MHVLALREMFSQHECERERVTSFARKELNWRYEITKP